MIEPIEIKVENKVASAPKCAKIFCNNSDQTIIFDFDEEWTETEKTARFEYSGTYQDMLFSGSVCPVPIINEAYAVEIGVYAGNIRTTTNAVVECVPTVLSGSSTPEIQNPDIYSQLLEAFNDEIDKVADMTVSAETLPAGSEATATKTGGGGEPYNLNFGIPKGADGDDGFSPEITVTDITGGHRVSITDADGTKTFEVMDGESGEVTKEAIEEALGYTPADEADLNEKIGEAPNDGKQYARQNNEWSEVIGVPYLSVVNGAVNITFEDGEENE